MVFLFLVKRPRLLGCFIDGQPRLKQDPILKKSSENVYFCFVFNAKNILAKDFPKSEPKISSERVLSDYLQVVLARKLKHVIFIEHTEMRSSSALS